MSKRKSPGTAKQVVEAPQEQQSGSRNLSIGKKTGFASGPEAEHICASLHAEQAAAMNAVRDAKFNALSPCDKENEHGCSCHAKPGTTKLVDLVILLDSSGSMYWTGPAVAEEAEQAIRIAAEKCPSDLRVTWLTVDGAKPGANAAGDLGDITPSLVGTPFNQTHQQYLEAMGVVGPFKQDEAQPPGTTAYGGEEGADAIADLAHFFDWRTNACRAILYISDEKLDSIDATDASAQASANNAASVARANGVVVFAHNIGPAAPPVTLEMQAYLDMCVPTGGTVYFGPVAVGVYAKLVSAAICHACDVPCKVLDLSDVRPCVSLSWGDSACDCLETSDFEVGVLTLCNCYANLSFHQVHIAHIEVVNADGTPVASLPDGRPAVQVLPSGGLCFDVIGPCVDGRPACVSTEVVIRTQGARPGDYRLLLQGVCFQVRSTVAVEACLLLSLCKD